MHVSIRATMFCGKWKHAPIFAFLVDRMRQNRYNTPRMPHQYGTIFINCGPRGAFSARRRVSAAPPKGVLPVKFFQEVKRNGYFSHLSAQEAPALQGARLPQENVRQKRTQGSFPPQSEGKKAAHLLIGLFNGLLTGRADYCHGWIDCFGRISDAQA